MKAKNIFLILAAAMFSLGLLIAGSAFAMSGFRVEALGTGGGALYGRTYDVSPAAVTSIDIRDENHKITLLPSPDTDIHIAYSETEHSAYSIVQDGGKLTVRYQDLRRWYERIGFQFNLFSQELTLYLPAVFEGSVSVTTSNAALHASAVEVLGDLSLYTYNAAIEAKDLSVSGNLTLTSGNGRVEAAQSTAGEKLTVRSSNASLVLKDLHAGTLYADTSNGEIRAEDVTCDRVLLATSNARISLDALDADEIDCRTSNGGIRGAVAGSVEDYEISASTSNGSSNLTDPPGRGERTLRASTSNADIELTFAR